MGKLIVSKPQFNLDEITERMFIEVQTKISGQDRTLYGVVSYVELDKIYFRTSGGSQFHVNLKDVQDGTDKIKLTKSLNQLDLMVKDMEIYTDLSTQFSSYNALKLKTVNNEFFSEVVINGVKYGPVGTTLQVTCNLGELTNECTDGAK